MSPAGSDPTTNDDPSAQGDWKHVSGPTTPEGTDDPVQHRDQPRDQIVREPRRRGRPARAAEPTTKRSRVWLIGLLVSALVVALAAGGGWMVSRLTPEPTTTQTHVATKSFPLELPLSVGDYSRDANQGNTPRRDDDGKSTVSATYSRGGQPAFVLLLARPYDDGKKFMQDLDMNAIAEVEDGHCGISREHRRSGCSVIRSKTGILVLSIQDMSQQDMMALTHQIADQLGA